MQPGQAEPPLRILTVTNRWPSGRHHGGLFVKQLVEPLRAMGHEVDVEVAAQGRTRLDYALAAGRVRDRVRAGRYDVVHVHYGLTVGAAALVPEVPRVISLYGSDINVWWQRWITRLGSRSYSARVYVSRRLAKKAGDPDAVIIPNGVNFDDFIPTDREEARASLGLQKDDRAILFGAAPHRRVKGWDLFADVRTELVTRGIRTVPIVLTEPGQPREAVVRKLDGADLLLFTSQRGSEGSPTVVKEAIAMGLPIVSVDVGDVAELLAGVTPSAVVPFPTDADHRVARRQLVGALADRASEVLADGRRADGRERCRWLDIDAIAARMVEVYRGVVAS